MRFGKKGLYIDDGLGGKLTLAVKRCTGRHKQDNIFIIDGDEGLGKTTLSATCAKFCAIKAKRKFNHTRMFFDPEKMMKIAAATEDQVFVWDEAAIGGLSTEWWKKTQVRLVKFLMVSRKKRHIYFLNIPKIFKLNEYLAVDRSIGLIHVYARRNMSLGWFTYYTKDSKEKLFEDYKKRKKRKYVTYTNLRGAFTNDFSKIIDEEEYDKMKNEAIDGILAEEQTNNGVGSKRLQELQELKYKITQLPHPNKELAKHFGVAPQTMSTWREYAEKLKDLPSNTGYAIPSEAILSYSSNDGEVIGDQQIEGISVPIRTRSI